MEETAGPLEAGAAGHSWLCHSCQALRQPDRIGAKRWYLQHAPQSHYYR